MSAHPHSGTTPTTKIHPKTNSVPLKIINPGHMRTITAIETATTTIHSPMTLQKNHPSFTKVKICDQVRHTVIRATKGTGQPRSTMMIKTNHHKIRMNLDITVDGTQFHRVSCLELFPKP